MGIGKLLSRYVLYLFLCFISLQSFYLFFPILAIIIMLVRRVPSRQIQDNNYTMLLVDNAFTVVCHAVSDTEVSTCFVRVLLIVFWI